MIFVKYYKSNSDTTIVTVKDFGSPVAYLYEYNKSTKEYNRLTIAKHPRELNYCIGKLGIAISEPIITAKLDGDIANHSYNNIWRVDHHQHYSIL